MDFNAYICNSVRMINLLRTRLNVQWLSHLSDNQLPIGRNPRSKQKRNKFEEWLNELQKNDIFVLQSKNDANINTQ